MKNEQNVPRVRFKGFTDAWEQRKLDTITDVRDGTHDSPQYVETGHPFITSKNVKDGFINYEDIQYVSDKDYEEINKRSKVDKNDILMGMIGSIGNIALVRETPDFAIKNVALVKDIGDVYYRYLYHCLQSNSVAHQLDENLDGGTQKFIALNKIRELVIPVPSEHEQHKIGDYMESLDNLITLHQRKCETLQKLKKSMLQKMFPKNGSLYPEIRFAGFTDAWEQRELGDCMETITDYVAAGSFADIASNVEYKNSPDYAQLIRTVDLKHDFNNSGFIYVDKKAFDYLWRVNLNTECIILPNIGANIGEAYYIEPSLLPYEHNVLGPNAILLKTKNSTKFMFSLFQADDFQNKLSISIASSGQPKFNKTELKEISLFVPSREEQLKIGEYFSTIDNLITLHQRKLETLQKLKKSMLQKMFI